jgi:hypothetical protein
MTALTKSPPAGAPAQLDAAAAQALERGDTVRVTYASGFTHRLRLEEPRAPASGSLHDLVRDLARRPADVLAAPDVRGAEALVRDAAKTHGAWRVWEDERQYVRWLTR